MLRFFFLSARYIWSTKINTVAQKQPLYTCFMDTTVHGTELCIFWTSQTFVSTKLCFLCVMHEFGHSSHEAKRCTFWTSCTGVSWKRPSLSIMRNFGYSLLMQMRILFWRNLHTGTKISLKLHCHRYMVTKLRHYSAGGTGLHMFHVYCSTRDRVVHILGNSNFCVRKLSFLCILQEFGHSSIT